MSQEKEAIWSWTHAAVAAVAAFGLYYVKPKDPTLTLISIDTSFKLNKALLDAELILTVQVTNPNIAPIHYSSTMSIYYKGCLLGSANVAGSQSAKSCEILRLRARLDGLHLAGPHAFSFNIDRNNRKIVLNAAVDIAGAAKVLWWDHKFKVHEDRPLTVDPLAGPLIL